MHDLSTTTWPAQLQKTGMQPKRLIATDNLAKGFSMDWLVQWKVIRIWLFISAWNFWLLSPFSGPWLMDRIMFWSQWQVCL